MKAPGESVMLTFNAPEKIRLPFLSPAQKKKKKKSWFAVKNIEKNWVSDGQDIEYLLKYWFYLSSNANF